VTVANATRTTQLPRDRDAIAKRIGAHVATLARPPYSEPGHGVTRYAFTEPYLRTVARVGRELDSVRRRGPGDGVLGTLVGVELCRLGVGVGVLAWLEEDGAGFGELLLGSRIAAGEVGSTELDESIWGLDDGRPFAEHCRVAAGTPDRLDDSRALMDALEGWIEVHVEQARVLESAGRRLGVVTAIAGYLHAGEIEGIADHASATPMHLRRDAGLVAAEVMLAAERVAVEAGRGTVATVNDAAVTDVAAAIRAAAERAAADRGAHVAFTVRGRRAATVLVGALATAPLEQAAACGAEPLELVSGAAHDTMNIAPPSALLLPPRRGQREPLAGRVRRARGRGAHDRGRRAHARLAPPPREALTFVTRLTRCRWIAISEAEAAAGIGLIAPAPTEGVTA
jgi:hypothetical protein